MPPAKQMRSYAGLAEKLVLDRMRQYNVKATLSKALVPAPSLR
jgi:hypothetical protein